MEITDEIDEDSEVGFIIQDNMIESSDNSLSIWLTNGSLEEIYNHLGKLLNKDKELCLIKNCVKVVKQIQPQNLILALYGVNWMIMKKILVPVAKVVKMNVPVQSKSRF